MRKLDEDTRKLVGAAESEELLVSLPDAADEAEAVTDAAKPTDPAKPRKGPGGLLNTNGDAGELDEVAVDASLKHILSLALPALGVLVAAPLYLLLDTAVVGHTTSVNLAALAAGTTIQAQVTTQLTFLSYGTTSRAARLFGAGDRDGAIHEGVQATWIAVLVGVVLSAIVIVGAPWFTNWLAADAEVAATATRWLRVAALGIPLILVTMAGNGWLRGVQNTRLPLYLTLAGVVPSAALVPFLVGHFGIVGSAWANLVGESITGCGFLIALIRSNRGSWRPDFQVWKQQLVLARDLVTRSLAFQISFLTAAAVAARFGAASLGAHQVLLQLWNFIALVLDALAIAAQSMIGAMLGTRHPERARTLGLKIVGYTTLIAAVIAVALHFFRYPLMGIFSSSDAVIDTAQVPLMIMVGMVLAAGVVFALDGILLGAGDAGYLRTTTLIAALGAFVPLTLLSYFLDWGLNGVWAGIAAFIGVRLVATTLRFRSDSWLR